VNRLNQRQGFLVSAIVHITLLMILISRPPAARKAEALDESNLERKETVFLPPPAELRRVIPPRPRPPAAAVPRPTPAPVPTPEPGKKDRISVGPPTDLRAKEMILRKEDDLTKVPKGQPSPATITPPTTAPAEPRVASGGGASPAPGTEGLKMPPGLGQDVPRGTDGSTARPGPLGPSIASAVRDLERRLARDSQLGIPTGTGQNLGGLSFDPQGADFTLWVNHFKNEVYRNWIVPQPALMGFKGRVEFEFTVERDGTMSALKMLRSSGTNALDRAAQNALANSRYLPLPQDYGPPRITMRVIFLYNEGPAES